MNQTPERRREPMGKARNGLSSTEPARRREPYHYDATGEQYIACILSVLQHQGQSIPVHVLKMAWNVLKPYKDG